MSPALTAALLSSAALLMVTAYFLLGSLPLLILKHDTPLDARFVRGFFNVYFLAAMPTAAATAVGYALAGRHVVAAAAAVLALLAAALRQTLMPRMDALRARIQAGGADAVRAFRRLHVALVLFNFVQLVLIVWSMVALSMQLR